MSYNKHIRPSIATLQIGETVIPITGWHIENPPIKLDRNLVEMKRFAEVIVTVDALAMSQCLLRLYDSIYDKAIHEVTIIRRVLVWQFPKERFVTYEPSDESWCRFCGIGREVWSYQEFKMPAALVVQADIDNCTIHIQPIESVHDHPVYSGP